MPRRGTEGDRRFHVAAAQRKTYRDSLTSEVDLTEDEVEFIKSMDQYKRDNSRPFPSWSEVLGVIRAIGYRKVADPEPLPVHVRGINKKQSASGCSH